jgi:hypothetical protein
MLNKIKKPDEYRIGYEFVELAEDIQKLRKAKLMLQHNISREKVCKYTTLEPKEIHILDDSLNQREEILNQIPDIIKGYLNYGYNYVDKIIVKKMIEDNCTNQEIQEFVNLTEDYINKRRLKTFPFFSWHFGGTDKTVGLARWATVEEEANYNHANVFDLAKAIEQTPLEDITFEDVQKVITASDNDGFLYNDALYVITNEQKEALLNYNTKEILEKENKQINYYKELIKNIEKHKLYHAQDVRKMKKQYNDIHNEGGEGYIPHFYTFEEYEYAKKQLAKLIKEQNK